MKQYIIFVCICLLCFFCFILRSQNVEAEDLTTKLQQYYKTLQTFQAEFTQILIHKESGVTEKRKGQLIFAKPLRIRWQTAKPHAETLVVTDKEIWDYLSDESVAYRYNLNLLQESDNIIRVVTGQAKLNRDFDMKLIGLDNKLQKIILYPKNPTVQMTEAIIWIEPNEGYIAKVRATDFYGNTNEISLLKFTPDVQINASSFRFVPPKGTEIEDKRNDASAKKLFN